MGFITTIQRYLGLEPVRIMEHFQKAERTAHLVCTRCGAAVPAEKQMLHTTWHRDLPQQL